MHRNRLIANLVGAGLMLAAGVSAAFPTVAEVQKSAMPERKEINNWAGQGVELDGRTRLFFYANQFKDPKGIQIDTLGVDAQGKVAIPKWSLSYVLYCESAKEIIAITNFFGPKEKARLSYDDAKKFVEISERTVLDKAVLADLKAAKRAKVLHGFAPNEISWSYDLGALQKGIDLARQVCKP